MTVAAFMELALYDPQHGYYARAAQRSGRAGDFFTSVDVGALFGELLEVQLFEMATLVNNAKAAESATTAENNFSPKDCPQILDGFDLVEAGAGNGRFAADMLHAAKQRDPGFYDSIRLHLVETSAAARAAQRPTLGGVADRLVRSTALLPPPIEGVLISNELLDTLATH